jgi:hypothetical protein
MAEEAKTMSETHEELKGKTEREEEVELDSADLESVAGGIVGGTPVTPNWR